MLATQDLQPSEFSQLAFEERPDDGADVDKELIRKCRERDLLDLEIASLAAQHAEGDTWDHAGFQQRDRLDAIQLPHDEQRRRGPDRGRQEPLANAGERSGSRAGRDWVRAYQGDGADGECT